MTRTITILLALTLLAGCARMRFVVDAVPAVDDLTETTVLEDERSGWGQNPKVALIDVSGLIIDAQKPGFLQPGENGVARFAESLRLAADDSDVKAIVVRVNSPGGTVTASDIVYRELKHFRESSGKPAVILMGDVAASGGYYLACAADEIIANPNSVTGSIGVVMQTVNVSEGLQRIGIRAETISSGPNKAMGSPFQPMAEEHRELLQGMVDEFYGNFVAIVRENRPQVQESDLGWVTDGRVVTGRQAVEIGLADRTGDLRDAFAAAKEHAGLKRARLVKYHRPLEHVGSAYADAPIAAGQQINLLQLNLPGSPMLEGAGFYYLWDPTAW